MNIDIFFKSMMASIANLIFQATSVSFKDVSMSIASVYSLMKRLYEKRGLVTRVEVKVAAPGVFVNHGVKWIPSKEAIEFFKEENTMDYKELLENSFVQNETAGHIMFLADHIFDFTTYDDSISVYLGKKAIEVCKAITNRKTFDYISDPTKYTWFLTMCNMPFFARRINWGTSIRGAFWDINPPNKVTLDSCGLYIGKDQIREPLVFTDDEWKQFMTALLDFAAPEMK